MSLIPSAAYPMAVEVPSMYCNRKMASAAISSNHNGEFLVFLIYLECLPLPLETGKSKTLN
jgi:hypothetical protein